jgi:hypothetical protein
MPDELETWKNPTEGRVWINRLDHRGELVKVEVIGGGRTFHISSQERKLNQEMAYNADLDIFLNGTLTPLRLIEGSEDAAAFAANPNLLSEDDMRGLVKPGRGPAKATTDAFVDRLATIKNPATLERLLSLAREEDAPLSRVEAIQGRLRELSGSQFTSTAAPDSTSPDLALTGASRGSKRQGSTRAVTPS